MAGAVRYSQGPCTQKRSPQIIHQQLTSKGWSRPTFLGGTNILRRLIISFSFSGGYLAPLRGRREPDNRPGFARTFSSGRFLNHFLGSNPGSALDVVSLGAIDGPVHLVPVNPVPSNNTMGIVDARIDVDGWNDVCCSSLGCNTFIHTQPQLSGLAPLTGDGGERKTLSRKAIA